MSLQDLPNELIAAICENADKNALMALRLTDKCISKSATKSFSDRFMSSLSLIMTAPCLERLVEICEHPSFGPGVRRISITPRRMNLCRIKTLLDRCSHLTKNAGDQSEEHAKAGLVLRRCVDRYNDEEALKKEGGATDLLTRAFRALKPWMSDVELLIVPIYRPHAGAVFLDSDRYEPHDQNAKNYGLTSTLQPCLEATRISKMGLRKFDVSVEGWLNTDKKLDFNLDSFSEEDMKRFSMLRSIKFELIQSISHETKRTMATVISQARELETLHLSHCNNFDPAGPGIINIGRWHKYFVLGDDALRSIKSRRTKCLSFARVSFSKQCLLELLYRSRNTLETLQFASCTLRDGSWQEIIGSMEKDLPLLSTLGIQYLFDSNSPTARLMSVHGFPKILIKGKERVQAAFSVMTRWPLEYSTDLLKNPQDDEALERWLGVAVRRCDTHFVWAGDP